VLLPVDLRLQKAAGIPGEPGTFPSELQDSLYGQGTWSSNILWFYSTDAPIEQVPVHWENRYLLSSFAGDLKPIKFLNTA